MTSHEAFTRAKRAHERRWGASTLPIDVCVCGPLVARLAEAPAGAYPAGYYVRSVDRENGSVVDWDFSGARLRRIAERAPTR